MKEFDCKDAVLLVAGIGDRLKPFTHDQPKSLTEVNGVTMLENAMKNLAKLGIKRVHLVTGYLHEIVLNCAIN